MSAEAEPKKTEEEERKLQLDALKRIDNLSEELQKEGKLLEALQCMEKSLILRGHVFGLKSDEVVEACKSVADMCNYLAMIYLQQDEFEVTMELLKKAEVLSEKHKALRAVTYNNMACYFRKKKKLRTALAYVQKSLAIETDPDIDARSADTHLNMCTILSELKRYEKALKHAQIALKLLLMELFGENGHSSKSEGAQLPPDRVAVLAIAYHNLAVQQESLRMFHESLGSYEKARKVVSTHLGKGHPLVKSLNDSYKQAEKKLNQQINRQNEFIAKTTGRKLQKGRKLRGAELNLISNIVVNEDVDA